MSDNSEQQTVGEWLLERAEEFAEENDIEVEDIDWEERDHTEGFDTDWTQYE